MTDASDTIDIDRPARARHAARADPSLSAELPRRSGRHRTKEPMVALDELELDDAQLGSIVRRLSSETF